MASVINEYADAVRQAVNIKNEQLLRKCLSADIREQALPAHKLATALSNVNLDALYLNTVHPTAIAEAAVLTLKAMQALQNNVVPAYEHYIRVLEKIGEAVAQVRDANGGSGAAWVLPAIKNVTKQAYDLAKAADHHALQEAQALFASGNASTPAAPEHHDQHRRMLFQKLQVVFTHCTTNDEVPWEVSTKQVGMYLVNHQLGVLFQLNNFKQCSNAITGLVNAYWPTQNKRKGTDIPESYFSKADLVTYKYYTGRLSLFEDKYEEALTALTTALNLCHKDAYHNRRKIITVLIPLHLNFGRFPTEALLRKYDLGLYLGFTNAIRTGSIRLYNQTLYGHQNYFVRIGTYLLLERVKNIVYRCYLKRYISLFVTGDGPVEGKSPLLDLQAIQTGLRLQGEDMDLPELECILCNLIHLNLVKGYVAHVQQKLVLSKDKPFPLESVVKPISM